MLTAAAITTLFIVITSVLPLFNFTHWFFRGMDFPRLQIASISAFLLIFHFIFLDLQVAFLGCSFLQQRLVFYYSYGGYCPTQSFGQKKF